MRGGENGKNKGGRAWVAKRRIFYLARNRLPPIAATATAASPAAKQATVAALTEATTAPASVATADAKALAKQIAVAT
jgi:hypothetical protein